MLIDEAGIDLLAPVDREVREKWRLIPPFGLGRCCADDVAGHFGVTLMMADTGAARRIIQP